MRSSTRARFMLPLITLLASLALHCGAAQADDGAQIWPTKEWRVSTPEEQGMDSAVLARFVSFASDAFLSLFCPRAPGLIGPQMCVDDLEQRCRCAFLEAAAQEIAHDLIRFDGRAAFDVA